MHKRILYLGTDGGTCRDRAQACRRLGHEVHVLDPRGLLPATPWIDRLVWRGGAGLFGRIVAARLRKALTGLHFDVCHVDRGELVTPAVIALLREHAPRIVSYNADDPFGTRDGRRFSAYLDALPHYDLVVVVREPNVAEARAAGARAVLRVFMSADEVAHSPRELTESDHRQWASEVLFLGTWMPERGPFLMQLAALGLPLTIRGDHWHKASEWPGLQRYWKGGAIGGDDYAKAIQCARINLGLLSKGNRDLHTTRSLEIPALGGLLCAERTPEHTAMYEPDHEAVFWSSVHECARVCEALMADEGRRQRIAREGQARVLRNRHLNESIMDRILHATRSGE